MNFILKITKHYLLLLINA